MGTAGRSPSAPYVDAEEIQGTNDLEVDFNNIYTELNGRLSNANFKSGAAIDNTKFATKSITGNQFAADTIGLAQMQASAVARCKVDTGTTVAWPVGTTFADMTGISVSVSMNVDNFLLCDFMCTFDPATSNADTLDFIWNIDGQTVGASGTLGSLGNYTSIDIGEEHFDNDIFIATFGIVSTVANGLLGNVTVKPQGKGDGNAVNMESVVLRVMSLPGLASGSPGSGRG